MITSCEECKVVCCQTGPGPHENLSPEEYLENFGDSTAYNTKCIALTKEGVCNLWGTSDFPQACRVYVCQTRSYSQQELMKIEDVIDRECPNCSSSWLIGSYVEKSYVETCEACGYQGSWNKKVTCRGKRKMKKIST